MASSISGEMPDGAIALLSFVRHRIIIVTKNFCCNPIYAVTRNVIIVRPLFIRAHSQKNIVLKETKC